MRRTLQYLLEDISHDLSGTGSVPEGSTSVTAGAVKAGGDEAAHGASGKPRPPERPAEPVPDPFAFDRMHDRYGLNGWPS